MKIFEKDKKIIGVVKNIPEQNMVIMEDRGDLDLTRRGEELNNSLSIALEINDNYQRENVALREEIEKLKTDLARAKEDHQKDIKK